MRNLQSNEMIALAAQLRKLNQHTYINGLAMLEITHTVIWPNTECLRRASTPKRCPWTSQYMDCFRFTPRHPGSNLRLSK